MGTVYLIPSLLDDDGSPAIPPCIIEAIKKCRVFFVENERTTRRYFKKIWSDMVIDDYKWHVITDNEALTATYKQYIKEGKNIGIVSEAGCPAVADPGQSLVAIAQQMNAEVKPLTGPGAILLALMASGMNGQHFQFVGYLPIPAPQREKAIKALEAESANKKCTQLFIETPYRNNQLLNAILESCSSLTRLCIAVNLTGKNEWVKTKTIEEWKKDRPDIHKQPALFLIEARY